jgi:hypothetical protein
MITHSLCSRSVSVLCGAVATLSVAFADPAADSSSAGVAAAPQAVQPGSWQTHQSNFWFMGFTATYSCDGLSDKLSLLLRQVGARNDAKVIPMCGREYGRPDKFAQAKLTFASLQPANASSAAAGNDTVPGLWRHVELASHRPYPLEGGDCELMEQFRDKLLPMFATRNLISNVTCVPHQDTGGLYSLSFDVFAPATADKKH